MNIDPFLARKTGAARLVIAAALAAAPLAVLSAHVVKGVRYPELANGFASSPSSGSDVPIEIAWAGTATGLRVACFYVANSSPPRTDAPAWPRVTAVGLALPGDASGFVLLSPLDEGWRLKEGMTVTIPGAGQTTLDFALVAPVNPMGHGVAPEAGALLGIPPGQTPARGSGTRFCVSGPFPDDPAISTPTPISIERLLNGVVLRFTGVQPFGPSSDLGVWENAIRQ